LIYHHWQLVRDGKVQHYTTSTRRETHLHTEVTEHVSQTQKGEARAHTQIMLRPRVAQIGAKDIASGIHQRNQMNYAL
jgi:hypothetical protein